VRTPKTQKNDFQNIFQKTDAFMCSSGEDACTQFPSASLLLSLWRFIGCLALQLFMSPFQF